MQKSANHLHNHCRNSTGGNVLWFSHTLIRPPPIIPPSNVIGLPTPKDPATLLLIRLDLCRKPFSIPIHVITRWGKRGTGVLQIVGDAQAELAHYGGPVAAAIVDARLLEICCWRLPASGLVEAIVVGIFEVAVVVVGRKPIVC